MKYTYHSLNEHPEVGKKVAVVELRGYSYEDKCFAVFDGEKWNFARELFDNKGVPIPEGRLYWREVLSGKMPLRNAYFLLRRKEDCKHIWGEGFWGDEHGMYYKQSKMREDMELSIEAVYRYCPICGKKLVLSEDDNEVELIEEVI